MSLQAARGASRVADGRAATAILLFLNAVFSGSLGVPLVLTLSHHGVSKLGVAAFFVVWNLGGASLNLIRFDRLKAKLSSSTTLLMSSTAVCAGLIVLWLPRSTPFVWVLAAAFCMATYSVQYPIYIGRLVSHEASSARLGTTMAGARRTWIIGYIGGLGFYAGAAFLGWGELQIPTATLLATIVLQALWRRAQEPRDVSSELGRVPNTAPRSGVSSLVLLGFAITLLRATDSLRSTYFPLFASQVGATASAVSLLFVVTAVCELFILRPLARIGDKVGSNLSLVLVALVGLGSMTLIAANSSLWSLLLSQVLYAFFTTGFQLLGVQRFVVASRQAERGASLFQGSLQVGSLIGVLMPLLIDGYRGGIFAVGAALCATASLTLLISARKRGDSCRT